MLGTGNASCRSMSPQLIPVGSLRAVMQTNRQTTPYGLRVGSVSFTPLPNVRLLHVALHRARATVKPAGTVVHWFG
jgi:hypothetical protein